MRTNKNNNLQESILTTAVLSGCWPISGITGTTTITPRIRSGTKNNRIPTFSSLVLPSGATCVGAFVHIVHKTVLAER